MSDSFNQGVLVTIVCETVLDLLQESMRAVNIRGQPTDYALKNYWLRSKSEVRSQESETDV